MGNDTVIAEFRAHHGRVASFEDKHLLLLTVPGRRTGTPVTAPLLYLPDGDAYVVFGLNGGAPSDPRWVTNLLAAGHATVELGNQRLRVRPERVGEPAAGELWDRQVAIVPEFEEFRARTARPIPIIRLSPTVNEEVNDGAQTPAT